MSWDGEVETEVKRLTLAQERRLMAMTELLRRDPYAFDQIVHIKNALAGGRVEDAKMFWDGFTNEEKQTLWIAPSKGGIFTTSERQALHHERKEA